MLGTVPGIAKPTPNAPLLPRYGSGRTRAETRALRFAILRELQNVGGEASTAELATRLDEGDKELGRSTAALRQLGFVIKIGAARRSTVWRLTDQGRSVIA
jgi:hypothetical protein